MGFQRICIFRSRYCIHRTDPVPRVVPPWLPHHEGLAIEFECKAIVIAPDPANIGYSGRASQQACKRARPKPSSRDFECKYLAVAPLERVGFHKSRPISSGPNALCPLRVGSGHSGCSAANHQPRQLNARVAISDRASFTCTEVGQPISRCWLRQSKVCLSDCRTPSNPVHWPSRCFQ